MNVTILKNNLADMPIEAVKTIAEMIAKSRMFDSASTMERAFTQLIIGQSLGLNILQSLNDLVVGKKGIELKAVVMASLVKRHPKYDYELLKLDDKECQLAWFEINGEDRKHVGTSSFNHADAVRAGLHTKETYKQYPKDMFFARALSAGAKKHASEAIGGASVYFLGELDGNERTVIPPPASNVVPIDAKQRAAEAAANTEKTIPEKIREIVGTNTRVVTQINTFLGTLFENVTLDTLETLAEDQLTAILEKVEAHAAKRAEKAKEKPAARGKAPAEPKPDRAAIPASDAQKRRIFNLGKSLQLVPGNAEYAPDFESPELAAFINDLLGAEATYTTLSKQQASNTIDAIQAKIKGAA
jgi:hypothetical protein